MEKRLVKAKDRVRRIGGKGCLGTVQQVRTEVTANTTDSKDKERPLLVTVLWDNGTFSYFSPEGLQIVEAA